MASMRFEPPDAFQSPRFAQLSTFMRLPYTRDVRGLDVAILGIPFDGGVSFRPGTPFRRALEEGLYLPRATVQFGIRGPVYGESDFEFGQTHGVTVVRAEEIHARGVEAALAHLDRVRGKKVYVSFDIDAVDPAFAPGTGTPEVGGLSSAQALALLRGLAGLEIVGFDIVEVSPPYDQSGITAMRAAKVLFELLSVLAVGRG